MTVLSSGRFQPSLAEVRVHVFVFLLDSAMFEAMFDSARQTLPQDASKRSASGTHLPQGRSATTLSCCSLRCCLLRNASELWVFELRRALLFARIIDL